MVRLLFATIGTILIATATTQPALANKNVVNSKVTQNQVIKNITPVNLVSLAYRGQLKGVPGHDSLLDAIAFRKMSGKDLIKHGIDSGRLSPKIINDSEYIKAVEYNLQDLLFRS